ncbi:hypothetical protein ES707_12193 [subsurface metagenome]
MTAACSFRAARGHIGPRFGASFIGPGLVAAPGIGLERGCAERAVFAVITVEELTTFILSQERVYGKLSSVSQTRRIGGILGQGHLHAPPLHGEQAHGSRGVGVGIGDRARGFEGEPLPLSLQVGRADHRARPVIGLLSIAPRQGIPAQTGGQLQVEGIGKGYAAAPDKEQVTVVEKGPFQAVSNLDAVIGVNVGQEGYQTAAVINLIAALGYTVPLDANRTVHNIGFQTVLFHRGQVVD